MSSRWLRNCDALTITKAAKLFVSQNMFGTVKACLVRAVSQFKQFQWPAAQTLENTNKNLWFVKCEENRIYALYECRCAVR